ncbi:Acyl-coenzyme A:6-aminopenicillanic-acid-acyltransferase 40 kDa form, putative [Penicillium digitatum PHI26]|uniref:Acyl-coenzyme A:6-aminopenicillanic-acid-acyltransferase 40 kDa form, putative n=2 Tax=Penicillium digitatum TaxID=36651 RepID=K9GKC3_PEND2|nr:Acyl-coenzyme A:6-aminopenicillanic-acid-acyltransferase 40 kDa form, putative [Penicillium digitatum Pd1]EKV05349.1 Acyl-coenzyme A:6-aminopenicillanic-acid-acyltransferase 40 kDa form, putative [Penicillium digitatum Pd1]EKV13676.1 Acyl-coenzyme A:6-aminopenicillanic-acid-acyltransferase 40 kDa form, putative [Penicillium digitatum PHI26]
MSVHPFYQHVVVTGLPYDRGFSYGEQTKEKIRLNVAYYKQPGKLGPWFSVSSVIKNCYIPGLQRYWPSGWEEMRGVAAGAGVTVEEIVMLNARYDLSHVRFEAIPEILQEAPAVEVAVEEFKAAEVSEPTEKPPAEEKTICKDQQVEVAEECTSVIILAPATRDREVFTAQNWDMSHRLFTEDAIIYLEIHPDSSENIPSMFLVTEAGQLGRSGCNSAGLGLTANSLQSNMDLAPDCSIPIPPSVALRRLFLEQSNYSMGLKYIARTPRHVAFNIMASSADDIGICLEVTPRTIFRSVISSGSKKPYLVHSNHFQTGPFLSQTQTTDAYIGGSSWYRGHRLEAGLRGKAQNENLGTQDIVAAFQDHAGYPHSLCEHAVEAESSKERSPGPYSGPTSTVCCVVYNLSKRTVRVCKGCPCEGTFQDFELR